MLFCYSVILVATFQLSGTIFNGLLDHSVFRVGIIYTVLYDQTTYL